MALRPELHDEERERILSKNRTRAGKIRRLGFRGRADDRRVGVYLKTLSEECDELGAFASDLTKAEASKRIDALKAKAVPYGTGNRHEPGLCQGSRRQGRGACARHP